MWIPNTPVMITYMKMARYISTFFLAYQGMIMLIVAYIINSSLVEAVGKANGNACSAPGLTLITLFLVLTIGNIAFIICQFVYLTKPDCDGNLTIMSVTVGVGCIFYLIVLFRTRDDASMFTSSLVLTYCLYLQWSAISS